MGRGSSLGCRGNCSERLPPEAGPRPGWHRRPPRRGAAARRWTGPGPAALLPCSQRRGPLLAGKAPGRRSAALRRSAPAGPGGGWPGCALPRVPGSGAGVRNAPAARLPAQTHGGGTPCWEGRAVGCAPPTPPTWLGPAGRRPPARWQPPPRSMGGNERRLKWPPRERSHGHRAFLRWGVS